MQFVRRFGGQRPVSTALLTVAVIVGSACSSAIADRVRSSPAIRLPIRRSRRPPSWPTSMCVEVSSKVREPGSSGHAGWALQHRPGSKSPSTSVDFSLVGGDVVTLTSSNFVASAVGAFQPGKVRVTFDINITNKLTGVQLVGPTVFPSVPPAPPARCSSRTTSPSPSTSGGTATGGQGNDIIVTLPSYGLVGAEHRLERRPAQLLQRRRLRRVGHQRLLPL